MRKPPKTPIPADHASTIHAQWNREMPDIDLDGARVLARAGRITLVARREIDAVFSRHGIDAGEFYVLSALRRAGPPFTMRPTEIYRSLMISSGGLTDRLRRLEDAGLVRRRASGDDKRSLLVGLTEKGRRCVEAAFREDMALENTIVSALDAEERATLAQLLQKLAASIGA